jgi:hypothetical protein
MAFMSDSIKAHPEWAKDTKGLKDIKDQGQQILADFKANESERIGTKRAELRESFERQGLELAEPFENMTDKQKSYGKITSKLSFAISIDEVEKIFTWAEIEYGHLTWEEKCLSIFQAAELIGTTPANYRGVRKILLAMIEGNTVEVSSADLQADTKVQTVQKVLGAKLLKAVTPADVEACFDWAEVELAKQLMVLDKYIVFFQIAEKVPLDEDHYKAVRKIFIRMNKD